MIWLSPLLLIGIPVLAGLIAAASVPLLLPWLKRIALAKVNDRSSHKIPTPQGGGLAVLAAILAMAALLAFLGLKTLSLAEVAALIGMAALGFIDDVHALPASRRIVAQALFLLIPFLAMIQVPPGLLLISPVFAKPVLKVLVIVLAFIGLLWIINLTNFMDGLDGIIVGSYAPGLLAAGYLLTFAHGDPFGFIALAAGGGLLGFGVWNWNPARIFLGDAGSLLIGLVTAIAFWLLLLNHEWVAAVLMWLYPFADATFTLARRLLRGEQVWQAHRQHAYQRGVDQGLSAKRVSGLSGVYALIACCVAIGVSGQGFVVGLVAVGVVASLCGAMILYFRGGVRVA